MPRMDPLARRASKRWNRTARTRIDTHGYPARHFGLSLPDGEGRDDVAALFERVAAEVRAMGLKAEDVISITYEEIIDEDGHWPNFVVTFSPRKHLGPRGR